MLMIRRVCRIDLPLTPAPDGADPLPQGERVKGCEPVIRRSGADHLPEGEVEGCVSGIRREGATAW